MKICAIIAEFNPFHNGHKFLIDKIKKNGFTHVVAIMSGNFVQRGEPAILSKKAKTQMALANGIDLVVEIPTVWSTSTAEKYAETGVTLANSLGCIENLVFGSECGCIESLYKTLDKLESQEFNSAFKRYISTGITFPKARELALKATCSDDEIINNIKYPNNILAIEYLKILKNLNSPIKPLTFRRSNFHIDNISKKYISASEIRNFIINKSKKYKNDMPSSCFEIIQEEITNLKAPCYLENAQQAILYRFKTLTKNEILDLPDVNEGLENRIMSASKQANSLDDLLCKIKTKRYTMSRIKRILLTGFLGINRELQYSDIPYIRILGTNTKGLDVLKKAKSAAKLPIISTYSEIKKLDVECMKIFTVESRASELYNFFAPKLNSFEKEECLKIVKGE